MTMSEYQWLADLAGMMDQKEHKKRSFSRKSRRWGYYNRQGPITPDLITEHLKGGDNCLAGLMLPDGEKTRFLVFDFDDHTKEMKREDLSSRANMLCNVLQDKKVPFFACVSGSGHGFHVWIVFEESKRSDVAREFGQAVLKATSKKQPESWGVYKGRGAKWMLGPLMVELLPKGSGQHAVALPCAREGYLLAWEDSPQGGALVRHLEPGSFMFETYKGKMRGAPKAEQQSSADRDQAFDCLAATYDPCNYDDWVAFAMRLIAAFGFEDKWARNVGGSGRNREAKAKRTGRSGRSAKALACHRSPFGSTRATRDTGESFHSRRPRSASSLQFLAWMTLVSFETRPVSHMPNLDHATLYP